MPRPFIITHDAHSEIVLGSASPLVHSQLCMRRTLVLRDRPESLIPCPHGMQSACPNLAETLASCETQHTAQITPRPRAAGEAPPPAFEVVIMHTPIVGAPEPVRQLHARMHPLLLFHVDAASPLQQDDPNMQLLLAVRSSSAHGPVEIVGFLTYFKCALLTE